MSIGTNLRVIRTSKNLTQKQLAQTLGITHNYLSMIENDAKKPSLTLLEKLSHALEVPLSLLFSELTLSGT